MSSIKFINFLRNHGCEVLPLTSKYEQVRWRGTEVGVIYTSGKTSGEYATKALEAYNTGSKWDGGPKTTKRKSGKSAKRKESLQHRDGNDCFFCGKPMPEDDKTIEHLIPLAQGGPDKLSNMALAHEDCNMAFGHMDICEKVKIAIRNRTK